MRRWPPIADPEVIRWLALDHEAWLEEVRDRWAGDPHPEGPRGSFLLRGGEVEWLEGLGPEERRVVVEQTAHERHPVVALGGNGAPDVLARRFDDEVLVLTGDLHDMDAGPIPNPIAPGYVPAALFESPGTAVRAALAWLTTAQLERLVQIEVGSLVGRLEHARFVMDEAAVEVADLFAFVARTGVLQLDGGPVALAAIPATGRTARALTQAQVLDALAPLALGDGAGAQDLARECALDIGAVVDRLAVVTWPDAVRLPPGHWTPLPGSAGYSAF